MGCSNPHLHGQIWAQRTGSGEPAKEGAAAGWLEHGRTCHTTPKLSWKAAERVVPETRHFVVLVLPGPCGPFDAGGGIAVQDITQLTAEGSATAWPGSLRRLTIRLRQPVQHLLPGFFRPAPAPHRWPEAPRVAPAHALLPSPPQCLGHGAQVHGGYEMLPSDPQRRHHLSSAPSACVGCRRCIG
jgi:hypothetical protein